jgi:hypothetical protein
VLSLPTGSIDVSDAWRFFGFALPPFLVGLGLKLSSHMKTGWLRIFGKVAMSVLLIPTCLVFLFLCLTESGCNKRVPQIYSPDRKHIGLLQFLFQGALGDDYAIVHVRRSWWPFAHRVYMGLGTWDFEHNRPDGPEVKWLDNSRLLVRYWDDRTSTDGRGGPAICEKTAGTVDIICENTAARPAK